MKRNRRSCLALSTVSCPVSLFGNAIAGPGRALLFVSLAVLGAAWSASTAQAQGVTFAGSANFGSVNVCPAGQSTPAPCNNTQTLSFNVAANTSIGSIKVLTLGAPNLDFKPQANDTSTTLCSARTYSTATTCTVDVTFAPLAPGQRNGAVQIVDGSGNILANTYIYGTGVGPAIAFSPSPLITLTSSFNFLSGVAVDASSNVYVVDTSNNAVYEILAVNGSIPANPTINTLASGFASPEGVAVDGSGNVFVADMNNNAVKEIAAVNGSIPANPTINTLASSFASPEGVAVDGSGNVFVADSGRSAVYEILAVNGSIPANPTIKTLGSGFSFPNGVAVDGSGNVYVADEGQKAVKEIMAVNGSIPANPTINTLGSGFSLPTYLAVDANGNVFVSDNAVVKEILAVNGSIPASNPTINTLDPGDPIGLAGVAVDGNGNVYFASFEGFVYEYQRSQPPSLSFASTIVGSTSSDSPQSVIFQNIGNQPLSGTGTLSDTTDFIQILGTSSLQDCTYDLTLNPGAECNLSFSFTPQSVGPLSGTLTLSDNALNGLPATQTIQLGGNGTIATTTTLTSSPNPSFIGQPVTFTATVTAASGPVPTGTVSFGGNRLLATETLSNGVASFTTSTLPLKGELIFAVYSGSATYASTSATVSQQVVNRSPTTTTLTTSANPSIVGQPVTFTATVAAAFGDVPSGTVRFEHLGALLATETLNNGIASFTTSTLPLSDPLFHITALYSGSAADIHSTSAAVAQLVIKDGTKAPTTTTLMSSSNPSVLGQPVTFTATVTATYGPVPSGTVSFEHLGALLATETLSNGVASFTTSALPLSDPLFHITALYSGSATNIHSTSAAVVQVVIKDGAKAPTKTILISSSNPSALGQPVTFTATVTAIYGAVPSGTVRFEHLGAVLATETLSNGVASFTTSTLPLSDPLLHITALYSGSATNVGSISTVAQTVKKATITTLTSSPNPSVFGVPVTFTATVRAASGPVPTGTVSLLGATETLSNGVASFTTSTLPLGRNHVIAVYSGSATYVSTSAIVSQQVVNHDAPTTTTLTSSANPSVLGQPVTFTATVAATYGGVPSGTVRFEHLGALLDTETLSNGVASFTTSTLPLNAAYHVTALYSGSATYIHSTSATVAQTVNKSPTTTTLISSSNPSVLGQPVMFTATVTATFGDVPSGTVRFEHLGALLGTETLSNGIASFTTSTLPLSDPLLHIIAVYSGSAADIGSTSAAVAQTVH